MRNKRRRIGVIEKQLSFVPLKKPYPELILSIKDWIKLSGSKTLRSTGLKTTRLDAALENVYAGNKTIKGSKTRTATIIKKFNLVTIVTRMLRGQQRTG